MNFSFLCILQKSAANAVGCAHMGNNNYRLDFADGKSRMATKDEIAAADTADKRANIKPITRAQAKAALIINGLIGNVQPAIDAIEDPMTRALAQNDWDERLTFERDNPTLVGMAAALGMTDEQLDALFVQAATL